jgi:hypothetical protein
MSMCHEAAAGIEKQTLFRLHTGWRVMPMIKAPLSMIKSAWPVYRSVLFFPPLSLECQHSFENLHGHLLVGDRSGLAASA